MRNIVDASKLYLKSTIVNIRRVATGVRELSDFKKTVDYSSSTTTNSDVEDMIRRIIAEYRK